MIKNMPYDELDRHHEQAVRALRDAVLRGDEGAYESSERLERRCRIEKVERARQRVL